ncbi:dTDP-4-dehydrorhamnose 3,5-epimerase [Paenibacillus sp. FSL K6-1230]|uniref:dTDP-4-dehydrorhamnose 3,5-epimerase n=1 Tax=Paenibacillus sp. FSL K6-1230 TaxID=2921603 RepID=UPI0030FBD709
MKFTELALKGAYLLEIEPVEDERGFFARSWCAKEFGELGLTTNFVQSNISYNRYKGILRGMHYQEAPYEEAKLVRCVIGSIYDVIVDLRPDSPTYKKWIYIELSQNNRYSLYIPKGFAHGFQTLQDHTEILYQMSEFYHSQSGRGILWNDPQFGIQWPIKNPLLSKKDQNYSLW